VEYFKYKQWADEIKMKALGTLRYTVNRLILDFEDDKPKLNDDDEMKKEDEEAVPLVTCNRVSDFTKIESETKREALERILILLNQG
jgi:hypothetical protein